MLDRPSYLKQQNLHKVLEVGYSINGLVSENVKIYLTFSLQNVT